MHTSDAIAINLLLVDRSRLTVSSLDDIRKSFELVVSDTLYLRYAYLRDQAAVHPRDDGCGFEPCHFRNGSSTLRQTNQGILLVGGCKLDGAAPGDWINRVRLQLVKAHCLPYLQY